jgi:acetate kinase
MTRVLVINAGSSSLKVSAIDVGTREPLASAQVDWGSDASRAPDRRAALSKAVDGLPSLEFDAAAHRVVHGGTRFREPVVVDDDVLAALDELSELAPLHNPVAVDTIRAQRALLPDVTAIAVFDTAFHATLAQDAFVYPLPWHWYADWGIRRFGFHGLSVAWSVRRAAELLDTSPGSLNLIVAHLGSGCSVTAVLGGASVATSMGLTPLEGLAMGTRSGSIDPGILVHVLTRRGVSPEGLNETLEHESGLLGISGSTGDVRGLVDAAARGDDRAQLALDIFVRRAAEEIAAAASNLPNLDALVFTGGIGENAASMRAAICERLAVVGVPDVDSRGVHDDALLAGGGESVAVLRIAAREDLVMAEAAAEIVSPQAKAGAAE